MSDGRQNALADFTTDWRVVVLTLMALVVGVIGALVACALVWSIGVITNLAYHQRFSSAFVLPAGDHVGAWSVLVPLVGVRIIGLMARLGSEEIRGREIPEALEAIPIGRSRVRMFEEEHVRERGGPVR